MKTTTAKAIVIRFDSVVDVITNSSSELFICKTNKSLATVEELLGEMIDEHNENILKGEGEDYKYYRDLSPEDLKRSLVDKEMVFDTPFCVGDNLELFIDRHVSFGWEYHKYAPLRKAFVGDVDELIWELCNDGTFIKSYNYKNRELPDDDPKKINAETSAKYQREKRKEFLVNNNTPEVLARLKNFIIIESLDENTIPYALYDKINSTFNGRNWHLG